MYIRDSLPWAVENGWTDRDAVWDIESDGSRERITWGVDALCLGSPGQRTVKLLYVDAPREGSLLGVPGQLKGTVKHRIWWLGRRVSCAKTSESILAICTLYDVFAHGLAFGVAMIAPALKFLVVLIFNDDKFLNALTWLVRPLRSNRTHVTHRFDLVPGFNPMFKNRDYGSKFPPKVQLGSLVLNVNRLKLLPQNPTPGTRNSQTEPWCYIIHTHW